MLDLLSSERTKKVQIDVEVGYVPANNEEETKIFSSSFFVTVIPGYPHRLTCLEAKSTRMIVSNGGNIPSKKLRFACYDMFNNQTAPKAGDIWRVNLGPGPLRNTSRSPTPAVVDAQGIATFNDIRAYVESAVPMDGVRFNQEVFLSYTDDSNSVLQSNSKYQPSCELMGLIIPGNLPASIAVSSIKSN
jgi:hypothetical protein